MKVKTGDVIRFTYTGNRYRVQVIPNGASLEPIGEITGMAVGSLSLELLQAMLRDGIIEQEVSDE